jgi:hypothetical protein
MSVRRLPIRLPVFAAAMVADFVFTGLLPDVCGGTPCYALPGG